MANDSALVTEALGKDFGDFVAVNDLSLEVPSGSIFGLLGPNGSGKTTTIRTTLGIYVPDRGKVRLLGSPDPRSLRHRVGYLPEERGLYPKMIVKEQLAFLGAIRGLSMSEANKRADSWLERLELADRAESMTNEFSKGMQQKVQFAAAVIHEPDLVVLDEPFTGLDPVNTRLLKELILEQQSRGCTVVLSSHRMDQVEAMCESIGLIHRGQLVVNGKIADIKASYGHNTLAIEYAGDPAKLGGIKGIRQVNDSGRAARLQMENGADPQAIVRALLEQVELRAFRVEEPSVEDIFLEKVGATSMEEAAAVDQPDEEAA